MNEACRRCQRCQSSASFLPASRLGRPYGSEAGYVRRCVRGQSSDSLTLQRAAAPELRDAMRAEFFFLRRSCPFVSFVFGQRSTEITRGLQTSRWLLSIGYLGVLHRLQNGDMIAHKPYLYFVYICMIKNAQLLLEHVFVCVCAAGLILLSASVLLRVNASAQSLRNRIPPVLQTQTHTHTQIHTHTHKTG